MPRSWSGNNVISFCLISNPFYTDHIESIIYPSNRLIMLNHMESITLINETAFDHLPMDMCCVDRKHTTLCVCAAPPSLFSPIFSPIFNNFNSHRHSLLVDCISYISLHVNEYLTHILLKNTYFMNMVYTLRNLMHSCRHFVNLNKCIRKPIFKSFL